MDKLPASAAIAPVELSRAAIERSLDDKGLKAQDLNISDDRVTARFTDVSFAALSEWLQQWQSSSQFAVSDATVSARDRLGRVDARLTLQRAQ
jgi:type II secretory pathway component PulM